MVGMFSLLWRGRSLASGQVESTSPSAKMRARAGVQAVCVGEQMGGSRPREMLGSLIGVGGRSHAAPRKDNHPTDVVLSANEAR
jgi:hypothetical protein